MAEVLTPAPDGWPINPQNWHQDATCTRCKTVVRWFAADLGAVVADPLLHNGAKWRRTVCPVCGRSAPMMVESRWSAAIEPNPAILEPEPVKPEPGTIVATPPEWDDRDMMRSWRSGVRMGCGVAALVALIAWTIWRAWHG